MTNSIFALDKMDFVFFDTETTGLSPSRGHRVITASVHRTDSSFQSLFSHTTRSNPGRPSDPGALAVHKISNEQAASFPAFTAQDADVLAQRDREPAIWAAHKADFDLNFLANEFSVVGAQPPRAAAFVDTVSIAKKLWPGKSAKLQDIYERTVAAAPQGITFHSSDDDTGALRDVFQVMKGEMQQRGMWNMEGLASTQPYGVFLSWPKQVQQSVFSNVNRSFAQTEGFDGGYIGASGVSGFVFDASNQPPSAPFVPQFMGDDEDDPSSYASPIVPSASLWTQGSVPRPFDLPLRDRRAFSAATNAYVARANDFFHRQGIDITVPSTSETGYKPAMASWGSTQTPRGAPLSTTAFRVGTWGYHTSNPLPTFGGNIITPVLQIDDSSGIWQAKTLQPHEVIGRALVEGRGAAQRHINKYYDPKMDSKAFESLVQRGERVGAAAVRSGIGMFATVTWAERYTATPGYTAAMQSSYQLESIGKYGILPRDLFNIIGQHGYFTRKPYASKDIENPERSTWAMYHVSSLGSSGWLYNPNIGEHGTFRTDVGLDKLPKRRQLMVQTAAVPEVDERLFNRIRRSRLSQDRSGAKAMYANALFVDNYPLSEGTAAIHPDAAPIGFRKMQHQFVERPRDAKAWSVDWNLQKSTQPGQALFLGTQLVNGREMPLQTIKGIRGVRQELWGVREIDEKGRQGFELAIGEHHPAESGGFKIFHSGVKALMMKSRSIVEGFRRSTGREFDVVAPLPKSWQLLQYGMIDYLPQKDLLGLLGEGGMDREEANRLIMGVRSNPKEQYQYLGPLQDALTKAIRGRRFEFEHTLQMDKRNIEAFRMAGSLVGEKDLGGDRVAATVKMTGYNLPMPLQYRQEFPGKKPFYSPEELKRLGARLQNVPSHMRDQAEIELIRLRKGSAASRIFGAAQATEKGYDPRRSMKYEEMDWIDIGAKAINIPGSDDEPLLQAIEAQMRERKALYITGPGGVVFPRPSDVKRMGALNLQGREMSTFVTSYVRAVTGLGDVAGDVPVRVAEFGEQLARMGSYSNVRRHAMGKVMERSIEGPYVGHVGIPDEYMVAGDDALMRLGGLRSREQLAGFKQEIEEQGFYAALSRRPQSSPTMQFETMLRVVSPEFAKREWDVDIEDLGRNFALSTTTAGVQRGDFDADRAIARALTRKTKSGELFTPDYYEFKKNDQRRQILTALQQQAPQDYAAYRATLTAEQIAQLDSALAGNLKDSMAIVRATYGIGYVSKPTDAKWNELAKWTESLQANKLHPDNLANSTDFWKSVKGPLLVEEMYTYTGAQVIDAFRRKHVEPKSQMGPVYNQYIRGLAALAVGPVEQAAAEAFGAITYQDTIDMEPMKQSVATLLDMTYYLGKSGSMHRHYSTPLEGEGNFKQITTNSGAVLGALLEQFKRLPVSRDMQAVLFSRDPQIQAWYKQGNFAQITREISRRGAGNYMVDPNQAGPLVQLVRSQQLAKSSWSGMQKTTMEEAAMRTGEGLGAYRGIYSKDAVEADKVTDKLRTMIDRPEEAKFMRSMMAMRTGTSRLFYSSREEVVNDLMNLPSFANPGLPGKEFPALISKKEADVLEGLRQMAPGQAQEIAAAVSRPARYTPAGGVQSFNTGLAGWDKLSAEQRNEITGMRQKGALPKDINARVQEMLAQAQAPVNASPQAASPFTGENAFPQEPKYWEREDLTREQKQEAYIQQWRSQGNAVVPAARIEDVLPALAWKEGHRIKAETHNQGRSWLMSSIPDRSSWGVANKHSLVPAFEEVVQSRFDPSVHKELLSDSGFYQETQGNLYREFTTLANRPSEEQLAMMPVQQQIKERQKILSAAMAVPRKMGMGSTWSAEMPELYKLIETQDEALRQNRITASLGGGGGIGGRAATRMPEGFDRILQQAIAGTEVAADDLNLVARTMGAGWEGRLREMAIPTSAQGQAMTPSQVKAIARQRLGAIAQAKQLYGDQEPEWLKSAYQEAYGGYKQARQDRWNEPVIKNEQRVANLTQYGNLAQAALSGTELTTEDKSWVLKNFGSSALNDINNIVLSKSEQDRTNRGKGLANITARLGDLTPTSVLDAYGHEMHGARRREQLEAHSQHRSVHYSQSAIEHMLSGKIKDAQSYALSTDPKTFKELSRLMSLPAPDAMSLLEPSKQVGLLNRAVSDVGSIIERQNKAGYDAGVFLPLRDELQRELIQAREKEAESIQQATSLRRQEIQTMERHHTALKAIVESPTGQRATSAFGGALTTAQGMLSSGKFVGEQTAGMVSAGAAFYKKAGYEKEAAEFAAARDQIELQAMAGEVAGQPAAGSLRERFSNAIANAGTNRQRSNSMMGGYLGQLNFGMWGAQMWWKWTGQPVQNWAQQYGGQQLQAQQAMFAAGQVNGGITGVPMDIMQTQAGVANAQWYLGQAGYNRWVRPLNALTGFISDNAQTVAQPIVDTLAGAGVLGLGQLGMTMLGSATGIPAIGAMGPYRMAGGFIRNTASIAGMGGSAFNAASGAMTAGGIASGLTSVGMYSGWLTNQAQEDIRYGPGNTFGALSTAATLTGQLGLAGQFRIASGFAGEDSWFRQKLENLPVIGDAYRFGGNILDRFMNAGIFGLIPKGTGKEPSVSSVPDAVTQQALGLKQYGIGVDQGTQLITSLNQMLGRSATDVEVVAFSKQGVQYPGGMQQQLSSYNQLFQATGAIAGVSGIEKIIAGSTGLTPAQIDQYTVASKIVGSVGERYGWTPESIWDKAQPIQAQIARGVTPAEIQARYAASLGRAGIASQYYGVEAGTDFAKRIEATQSNLSLERQEQVGSWRSRMVETLRSGGMSAERVEPYVAGLSSLYSNSMQELTEMTVLAKSVILQTDRGTIEGLTQEARGAGVVGMSPAQRQQWFQRSGGFAGLAPTTMVQGGTQAASFETGLALQSGMTVYQNAAAQILQQTRPGGYSQEQLDLIAGRLYRSENINTVSSDLLSVGGRMGIGAAMGFGVGTGASAAIDVQARSTAQFLGGQGTVSEKASYLASFVSNPQYLTGSRAAAALIPGSAAYIAYQNVSNGRWSPYQGGLMAQLSDRYNPLGYTANLAYEQGTFSEFLAGGVPAGGLQDIYGRQPGAEAMFGAQQASGWSSYRLGVAQEQVRQARFGRQVNEWRQEWGSGAYTPTSQVMQAISRPQGATQITVGQQQIDVSGGVAAGLQVGGSTIGLVQQEAAIRRQMWQENLNYQRQSFAFAQQQLQLQKEQLALSRQEYSVKRQYQLGEREAGRGMQLLQREWTQQDWAIQGERIGITNQWAQEDITRAIRYSTGRERVQLMRQRERMTIQQGWEGEDRNRSQDRQRQQWRYEDERYEKAIQNEQALHDIQMQRFALQERSLDLQGAQLAAQMAHAEKMAGFEAELQKIEDERFKTNFENMQKQIEEELKLEPVRKEAIAADLAYQATRLANAQTIWDAEKQYMEWLKQMIIDVAAEWVKLRSAQAGQSSPSTAANQCPTCGQTFTTPAELQAHLTSTGHGNMRAASGIGVSSDQTLMSYSGPTNSSQPVTVNFMLDGEIIMSTVVTPERLRPVVQEVDQRNRRR